MADKKFEIQPDVRCHGYIDGRCPNCGRMRLELWTDGVEVHDRAVAIRCEKCNMQWMLDPMLGSYWVLSDDRNPLNQKDDEPRPWDVAPWPPKNVSFDPLGGAARGIGRCTCLAGPGTNPACPVHP